MGKPWKKTRGEKCGERQEDPFSEMRERKKGESGAAKDEKFISTLQKPLSRETL